MSERSLLGPGAVACALVLGLSLSCGGGDGTGPDGGGDEPAAEFGAALEGTADKYFGNNAAAFLSLQTFAPFFSQGLLSLGVQRGAVANASLVRQGCIDPGILGTTYEYDFGQSTYFAGGMTGAPADGIRFLLYQGQEAQGHVDILCPGDPPIIDVTLEIEWDGVTVFQLSGTGLINANLTWQFNSTAASLRDPLSGDVLEISTGGTGSGPQVVSSRLGIDITTAALTVTFGRNDFGGVEVTGTASKTTGAWNLGLRAAGTSLESLSGNVALSTPITEPEVIACLSGPYDAVVVSEASAACAGELPVATGVTSAQRAAIGDGYNALRGMLDTLIGIMGTGVEVALAGG